MNTTDAGLNRIKMALFLILSFLLGLLTYQVISEVKSASDDVLAQAVLRKISGTLEDYHQSHGIYPRRIDQMMMEEYPYKIGVYFTGVHHGFRYTCDLSDDHYTISAHPDNAPEGAGITYSIKNGGELFAVNPL
ncbi:MAG TPA: hypothetical protein PLT76_08340 [Candidatus Omnitrophota bacterium]|nr:hypothetical protein [Candidatus Omnitrophota bacterium]HPB67980.1 hypothetical protein [Candidatus Omnitrophota bacterium]HQO58709.1 hypothetical protein [Candidatus Omnitrophota bacterium]